MAERSTTVRLRAEIADFRRKMREAKGSVDEVAKATEDASKKSSGGLSGLAKSARDNREAWTTAGSALAGFGVATVGALGLTARAAIGWESAWTGVLKTVNGSTTELAGLEGELRQMARTLPASHQEIAAVAEAAGQLGVQTPAVAAFTRTMIDLGETTNLTADEAATALARISNIMGTSAADVSRMGATIVDLGNKSATTEREIVELGTRLAAAGRQAGLSESDVFAFASTLTSVGVEAEAGGTAMSKVFTSIADSVRDGGEKLETFASVAGVTAEEFSQAFGQDAAGAIALFVDGMGQAATTGESTTQIFKDLELTDQRLMRAILSAGSAQGLLNTQLQIGRDAWADNTALIEEAAKRYDTTEAKIQIAKNSLNDTAITIGDTFLPMIADAAERFAGFAEAIGNIPEPLLTAGAGLGAVAGTAALVGGTLLMVVPRVVDTVDAFKRLKVANEGAASSLGKMGKAAGMAAGAAALGAVTIALVDMIPRGERAALSIEETTSALLGLSDVNLFAVSGRISDVGSAMDALIGGDTNDRLSRMGKALDDALGTTLMGSLHEAEDQFLAVGQSLGLLVQQGQADRAADIFAGMAEQADAAGYSVDELKSLMPGYTEALAAVANQQELAAGGTASLTGELADLGEAIDEDTQAAYDLAAAFGGVVGPAGSAFESLGAYARQMEFTAEQTEELIDQTTAWSEAVGSFVNPLGAYTDTLAAKDAAERKSAEETAAATESAEDSWEDYFTEVSIGFAEYIEELQRQVDAQENWQVNMLSLAGRVSQGTLDYLARLGPEGAPLVADLVNRSDEELVRFSQLTDQRSGEAMDAFAAELRLAQPILATLAGELGQGAVDELAAKLAAGTITVAEIASQYADELANGVNPILTSLGRTPVRTRDGGFRAGNGQMMYREGGINAEAANGHVAEIAPAGAWRVWAEPETGGEAYIPLAPAKRDRSLNIWQETGRRLGVQGFLDGGFTDERDVPKPRSVHPYRWAVGVPGQAAQEEMYGEAVDFVRKNSLGAVQGDLVGLGRKLQQMGFRVGGHPEFGGVVPGGHRPGSYHYRGRAIDVNFGPPGQNAIETRAINALMPKLSNLKFAEKLWQVAGHFDHLHLAMAKGGVLNPHVRDQGGPLLPGYTYNGTGRNETVVPHAAPAGVSSQLVGEMLAALREAGTVIDVGGIHTDARPEKVLDPLLWAIRAARRGGVYSRPAGTGASA